MSDGCFSHQSLLSLSLLEYDTQRITLWLVYIKECMTHRPSSAPRCPLARAVTTKQIMSTKTGTQEVV
ncbi:uncharacterized protein YALI1_F11337g [Yarrowia lipolytica]|uniref:Uncharacterized protein n=1 Tax=Yarrowia lipolytica TaxID=4952 RepID=A0A1D8NMF6_YARLL|nr:hypothetical protein YALI1_F11337g [Yarrowia lipolytica]